MLVEVVPCFAWENILSAISVLCLAALGVGVALSGSQMAQTLREQRDEIHHVFDATEQQNDNCTDDEDDIAAVFVTHADDGDDNESYLEPPSIEVWVADVAIE